MTFFLQLIVRQAQVQTIATPQVTCLAMLYQSGVDVQLLWHAFGVNCLQFSADGCYLFSGGVEVCSIARWNFTLFSTCL